MSNTFLYSMPTGIPGNVQRLEAATIEAGLFDADYPCEAYGILVKKVEGLIRPVANGDTIASLTKLALLARPYPIQEPLGTTVAGQALAGGVPDNDQPANLLRRGYMTVVATGNGADAISAIVAGDPVYVRTTASPGEVLDFEGGSASGNQLVPNMYFTGTPDSDGNVEVEFNL